MRRTATASDTESVAGSPSGTIATMTPSANTNESTNVLALLVKRRSTNSRIPRATATSETRRAIDVTWRCSGLGSVATLAVREKMRPNSVRRPVANTTAVPVPLTTEVPMNTELRASVTAPPAGPA